MLIQGVEVPTAALVAIQGLILAPISYALFKFFQNKKREAKRKSWPQGVVILHQFPRGLRVPNPSPFGHKVETWLRMAKIKYQNDHTFEMSPKGKSPWITYNGRDIGDSQLIIEFIMKEFNVDFNAHLSPLEKSQARAYLKLVEESLRWVGVVHRFKYGKRQDIGFSALVFKFASRSMLKDAYGQGYGRHTQEEVYDIGRKDMDALETFIGNKKYLMGDKVCNEDPAIFAMIAQVINHDRGPMNAYCTKNCPNLVRYYETMKSELWPDWNEVIREKQSK